MALKSMVRFSLIAAVTTVLLGQIQALEAGTSGDAAVRDDFLGLCADCHGADGKGNGPLTKNLTKFPPDLTRIKLRANGKFDEKAVFDWIIGLNTPNSHGTREMPIWGDWLMDETLEDGTSLEAAPLAEKEVERRVMAIVKYLQELQISK
jgi:mono/diheme cytochrome c family protein